MPQEPPGWNSWVASAYTAAEACPHPAHQLREGAPELCSAVRWPGEAAVTLMNASALAGALPRPRQAEIGRAHV